MIKNFVRIRPEYWNMTELAELFPELMATMSVIENNPWHDHQDVFEHTRLVTTAVWEILDDLEDIALPMEEIVGGWKRRDALVMAAILHDIAKKDVLGVLENGQTVAPVHEQIGMMYARTILSRLGCDEAFIERVSSIVLFHGFVHEIVNFCLDEKKVATYVPLFRQTVGSIAVDLLIHSYADMKGSDLQTLDQRLYEKRMNAFYFLLTKIPAN